jgi:hypothetical protein
MKVEHNAKTGVSPKLYDALDEVMLDIAGRKSNHTQGLGLSDTLPLITPQQQPDQDFDSSISISGSQDVQDFFVDSLPANQMISVAGTFLNMYYLV